MRRLTFPALALLALCLPVPAHAGPIRSLIHRIFHGGGAGASACTDSGELRHGVLLDHHLRNLPARAP